MSNDQKLTTRREFLGTMGKASATVAAASSIPIVVQAETRKIQYGMVIDIRQCKGCHACSIACKSEFNVELGVARSWVETIERGEFPKAERAFLPRLCNHCEKPACVKVCPVDAAYKREEDGIVVFDQDECIGCKKCVIGDGTLPGCPYGTPFMNPATGTAQKCDLCLHRVKQGVVPSCVNTCPGHARFFGDVNDPNSVVSKMIKTENAIVQHADKNQNPNVYYIGMSEDELNKPKPSMGSYLRVEKNRPNITELEGGAND